MKNLFFTVSFSVLFLVCTSYGHAELNSSPQIAMREFLTLDAKGYRLNDQNYSQIRPFVKWSEAEPAWDKAEIISEYRIINSKKLTSKTYQVQVEYTKLGSLLGSTNWTAKKSIIRETFKLELISGHWYVKGQPTLPRVKPEAMIRIIQKYKSEAKAADMKEMIKTYDKVIDELSNLKSTDSTQSFSPQKQTPEKTASVRGG